MKSVENMKIVHAFSSLKTENSLNIMSNAKVNRCERDDDMCACAQCHAKYMFQKIFVLSYAQKFLLQVSCSLYQ
jgi:hypothetical protein